MREFPPSFWLDTVNQCLWRGDGLAEERILLAPKAFAVLRYLVEHPGRLVSHDETLAAQAPTWLVQFRALLTRDHDETLRREVLGATRERMLREIGDALEVIASRSPLVIVFEDLQGSTIRPSTSSPSWRVAGRRRS